MKKLLLIVAFLFGVFALHAQKFEIDRSAPKLSEGLQVEKFILDDESSIMFPYQPYNDYTSVKGAKSISKVGIGSSDNPYGVLLASQQCLTYCPELGLIMFTHRQDHTNPGNSGYIQTTFSTDGGLNWDNNIVYDDDIKWGRYPSGAIYNPAGNTNPDNAFAVTAGPYTDGQGWKGNFYASMQFDGSNDDVNYNDEDEDVVGYTNLVRNFLQIDSQGRVRIYGEKNLDDGEFYTDFETAIYTGEFDAATETWDWTETLMVPDYTVGTNGNPDGYRSPGMAWSKDGEIGYMIYVGRSVNAYDPDGYHPMIYKTEDAGDTWTLEPGFDWTGIPAINNELIETNTPGVKRASFSLIKDAVVDANGHLHFTSYINSASSTHPDSLGYIWVYQQIQGLIYHMRQTPTGWDAEVVDIQWAKNVSDADSPIGVFWRNRLQMSKTQDEEKIIFAWTDTDEMFASDNLFPDVIVQMYDINTGERTASQNLTQGTTYDGLNYFMYLSNWSGYNAANGDVILHITTSEYGSGDLEPVYHYYLKGARIKTNINEPVAANKFMTVSQNYPNPFNNSTAIDISLERDAHVSIEILNMLGQNVSSTSKNLTAGTHTVALSAENLTAGVYFYTVTAGDNKVTNKMIVR